MFEIRQFEEQDADEASKLIRRTVRESNSEDYSSEIIQNLCDFFSPEHLIEIASTQELFLAIED